MAAMHPPPPFLRLYFPFAAGYFVSYVFRTVNAVISPELTRDLGLGPSALGLLTSAYFIAFGAMQLPSGMLLDRFGPRRVEPALLALAATGALLFGLAQGAVALTVARVLIGIGAAACLMAPLKGLATWYPADRQASLAGWMMVSGGLGALVSTAPLEFALRVTDWRHVFIALAIVTYATALWIWWRVPDVAGPASRTGHAKPWTGVRTVFADRRFWWIAPLGSVGMGSFMAVQGLWSIPWLMEVSGFDRVSAARHLMLMSLVTVAGYLVIGAGARSLARRGVHARHVFAAGFACNVAGLAMILAGVPGSYLWWCVYGLGSAVNVLGFNVVSEGFPRELAARANTALNLLTFVGSFTVQWGIGVVVDAARAGLGLDTAAGLRLAFAIVLALELASYAWFVVHWRRHAVHRIVTLST